MNTSFWVQSPPKAERTGRHHGRYKGSKPCCSKWPGNRLTKKTKRKYSKLQIYFVFPMWGVCVVFFVLFCFCFLNLSFGFIFWNSDLCLLCFVCGGVELVKTLVQTECNKSFDFQETGTAAEMLLRSNLEPHLLLLRPLSCSLETLWSFPGLKKIKLNESGFLFLHQKLFSVKIESNISELIVSSTTEVKHGLLKILPLYLHGVASTFLSVNVV